MKKISIIVPVYNVENYLKECLDSLINQCSSNCEIIVVNDGSTDGSLYIAKEYEKKYDNIIKVYDKKNGGLSSARNFGISRATGEYLLFVDSDDYLLPNCLEILEKIIDEENIDIIVFSFLEGSSDNYKYNMMYNNDICELSKRYIVGKPCATNKLCKKSLFLENKIEFLNGVYYEDLATMPKLILHSDKIKFIKEPLYFYRIRNNSIMNKKMYNHKMDTIFDVLDQLKKYFNDNYYEEIEYLYIEHLLRGASIRYFDCGDCQEQLDKIVIIMKDNFPNWQKNKYLKKESIKRKVMCYLFYKKYYKLIKMLRSI